jgi:hypothetical protein
MSSTGRNIEGHERDPNDFYETPQWCVHAMWRRLSRGLANRPGITFVDAGAGEGAIAKALRMGCVPSWQIALIENDPKKAAHWGPNGQWAQAWVADYLITKFDSPLPRRQRHHVTIMNPPYSQAMEFVQHATKESIRTIALLRFGFIESRERYGFHRANQCNVYVLAKRPSFAHGKTDSAGYAWFEWPGEGRLEVLDLSGLGLKGYDEPAALLKT